MNRRSFGDFFSLIQANICSNYLWAAVYELQICEGQYPQEKDYSSEFLVGRFTGVYGPINTGILSFILPCMYIPSTTLLLIQFVNIKNYHATF